MIEAADDDTFIGGPGAVLDGRNDQRGSINGPGSNVTVEYLTIENVKPPNNSSALNSDDGLSWTIRYDQIGPNGFTQGSKIGYGVDLGSYDVLADDCITENGQGGFNSECGGGHYCSSPDPWGGPRYIVITGNEISRNGLSEFPDTGCGCAGGGKLFWAENVKVTQNYVHDNYDPGLWFDFNNAGFNISDNYIASNFNEGLVYEASYNASVTNNTFVGNGWASDGPWPSPDPAGAGPLAGQGFPMTAIYLPESGGDANVASRFSGQFIVSGNVLTDNWGGILAFQDRNRFCGSPDQTGDCTLDNPALYYPNTDDTAGGCGEVDLAGSQLGQMTGTPPAQYFNDCIWNVQNLAVSGNTFTTDSASIPGCTTKAGCGYMGLFGNSGSGATSWSPYAGSPSAVDIDVSQNNNNVWSDNTYSGLWNFMVDDQGKTVPLSTWQSAPYNQDAGSTFQP